MIPTVLEINCKKCGTLLKVDSKKAEFYNEFGVMCPKDHTITFVPHLEEKAK